MRKNEMGTEAMPLVEPVLAALGRSLEKEKLVPPPDLCMSAAYFDCVEDLLYAISRSK